MGNVIYSASSFQAFFPAFETIAFVLLVAVVGLGSSLLNRKQSRGARIGLGVAGGFLLIVGFVLAVFTVLMLMSGHKTVNVLLNNKREAVDNCGDNGQTCTRLVLETQGGSTLYDFTVPQRAFEKAAIGQCYQVSYYPNTGLFSSSDGPDSYVATSKVTQIKELALSACQ